MAALRYFLITVTSLALGGVVLAAAAEGGRMQGLEVAVLLGVGAVLFANFMYLLSVTPTGEPTKGASLFKLWLTAKENELRTRARSPHDATSASSQHRN
jgi:hypothetical protein